VNTKKRTKKGQISLFIILGIIILISASISSFVYYYSITKQGEEAVKTILKSDVSALAAGKCSDGTSFGECSNAKPFFCEDNILFGECSRCGCPPNAECLANGLCEVKEEKSDFTIYFLPINYEAKDLDFLTRAEIFKASLKLTTPLKDTNFVVIDKTLRHPTGQCDTSTQNFFGFVDQWLQERTGEGLAPLEFQGGIPVFRYRIIGIDQNAQDTVKCGCGFTLLYSPNIYIGGSSCSREVHVALHEVGHTFSLCDEYDTCEWSATNEILEGAFGHPCLNARPDASNSNCGNECCSVDAACCSGKYANTRLDGFFNVMGSSSVPPQRRVSDETGLVMTNFLCANLGVCNE